MAALTQIPKTNISVVDIKDTLNANGGSVSNDTTTFFTAAAKVNPWSKHKPVPLSSTFCQDFDSSRADYDDDWWKGNDGKCGLSWNDQFTTSQIEQLKTANWSYTPPSSSYPRRLGDFAGYIVSTNPPIATRITSSKIDVDQTLGTWTFEPDIYTKNYNELTIYDFDLSLSDWYLCALVSGSGGGWNRYIGDKVLTSGCKVDVNLNELSIGEHTVILCLARSKDGNFMPLPSDNDNKTTFTLNVQYVNDLFIEFVGISSSLKGTYTPLENYTFDNGYTASNQAFFKVSIKKMKSGVNYVKPDEIYAESETWSGERTGRYLNNGTNNWFYNSSQTIATNIDISTLAVGSSVTAYIYWGNYGSPSSSDEPRLAADLYLTDKNGSWLGTGGFYMQKK